MSQKIVTNDSINFLGPNLTLSWEQHLTFQSNCLQTKETISISKLTKCPFHNRPPLKLSKKGLLEHFQKVPKVMTV